MAPIILILMIKEVLGVCVIFIEESIRINPYPPSLRRIAAKIIDPATGASTWALGSHKWIRNRGSLARNAMVDIYHQRLFMVCEINISFHGSSEVGGFSSS